MLRTRFETGIEDGRRVVAAFDVPADYGHSLLHGLEFGVAFAADADAGVADRVCPHAVDGVRALLRRQCGGRTSVDRLDEQRQRSR
jgi:hypothetical protein